MVVGLLVVLLGQVSVCVAQYQWNSIGTRADIQPNWNRYFQQNTGYTQYNQRCSAPISQNTLNRMSQSCPQLVGGPSYGPTGPSGVSSGAVALSMGSWGANIVNCADAQAQAVRERCDPFRQPRNYSYTPVFRTR